MIATLRAVPTWAALTLAALAAVVFGILAAGLAIDLGAIMWAFGALAAGVSVACALGLLAVGEWERR